MVEQAFLNPGFRGVCIREVQKSLKDSAKRLIEDKVETYGLGPHFDCLESETKTPGGGLIVYQGMQDHTSESIKSLEGFDVAWVEEAQSLSQRSLTLLRPTIRKEMSELWFSWNRTRKNDPVDVLLTGDKPPSDCFVVKANHRDNPWFPDVLEAERQDDERDRPDQYPHIWEGDYSKVTEGAYYAAALTRAQSEGRICRVAADDLMEVQAFWDIGGTGAKADACAIWVAQFIGREIRILNYYEAVGQPLSAHVHWLRRNGYGEARLVLPHDGATNDRVYDVSYESALRDAGFVVDVVPNQGRGAAAARIETARRVFPRIWFNGEATEPGRDALGAYHERKDEARNVGLGPEHDWSSHGADAFGLMCVAYIEPMLEAELEESERQTLTYGRSDVTGY